MLIKIISLLNSSLRKVERQFSFIFFDAIDNEFVTSKIKFNINEFFEINNRLPTVGEIGCSLSHASVLKEFSSNNLEWVCILEDDALIENNFVEFLENVSKEYYKEATIVVIGYSKTRKANHFVHKFKYPLRNSYYIGECKVGKSYGNLFGTVGYLANNAASEKFKYINEVSWVADDWCQLKNMGINILHISKPLIYEDLTSPSSTGNVVHCVNSLMAHPFGNFKCILKVQIMSIGTKLKCILKKSI